MPCIMHIKSKFDIIKSKFKCQQCLKVRRSSLGTDQIVVACNKPILRNNCSAVNSNSVLAESIGRNEMTACEVNGNVANAADICVEGENVANVEAEKKFANENAKVSNLSLELLYNEIISLMNDNAKLISMVSLISDDNAKLHNENNSLVLKIGALGSLLRAHLFSKNNNNEHNVVADVCDDLQLPLVVLDDHSILNVSKDINNIQDNDVKSGVINKKSYANLVKSLVPVNIKEPVEMSGNLNYGSQLPSVIPIKEKNIIIGSNKSDELEVFSKWKWLHVSSFKSSVAAENLIKYISKKTNIAHNHFECYKLVKKTLM